MGTITVYDLDDTSKVSLPGDSPLDGNDYSEFVYERIEDWTNNGYVFKNHFLLYIDEALLSMMKKDYGMLDIFPEYYGENVDGNW